MDIVFRVHALKRMAQRAITREDVRSVIGLGSVIEEYPTDTPYPSRLLLGWVGGRPLHVVLAEDLAQEHMIVITVYQPDPKRWTADFARRMET